MEIKLTRKIFTDDSTIGDFIINDVFFSFCLEDKVRAIKIKNITAIPAGRYEVIVNWSNRFQMLMPLLLNVPGYEGVRIHWGNYSKDTEGCLLLGETKGVNFVGQSKSAFAKFMTKLKTCAKSEKIWITIT